MAIQTAPSTRPETGPANPNHARRWLVLCIVALAQLTVVLDGTIVTIALPQAQEDLGINDVDRQWATTAYALAFGALLLLGGRIADYWGRKRSFMVGMAGFAVASGIGGLAQNGIEFYAARAGQGVFAALLAPAALAIVTTTFVEVKERAKAFAVLVTLGLGSLVYGFSKAEHGWATAQTLGFIGAGLALLAVFVVVESRSANPILPLGIPWHRDRGAAYIGSTLVGAALLGGMLYLTIYTQLVLGFSPVVSGLSFLPMTAAIVVAAGLSSQLGTKIGPKPLMAVGPVIAAAGLLWLTRLDIDSAYVTGVLPGVLLFGFGLGLLMVQMQNIALVGVADHDAGAASALANATVQIGGALGTALFTTIYVSAKDAFRAANPMPTAPVGFPTGLIPADLSTAMPPSEATVAMLPPAFRDFLDQLKDYLFSTEVSGYVHTFAWAAVLVAVICPVVLVLVRAKRSDVPAEGPVHLG